MKIVAVPFTEGETYTKITSEINLTLNTIENMEYCILISAIRVGDVMMLQFKERA